MVKYLLGSIPVKYMAYGFEVSAKSENHFFGVPEKNTISSSKQQQKEFVNLNLLIEMASHLL
jgi:hypothetical protein